MCLYNYWKKKKEKKKDRKDPSGNCVGVTEWEIWSFVIANYFKWEGLNSLKKWMGGTEGLMAPPHVSSHICN